jgi:hypothetical protein
LAQVQADELWVKLQGHTAWICHCASFPACSFWGAVSRQRDKDLILQVMDKVRKASGRVIQPILIAVDGFIAYPKLLRKLFATKDRSGRGRPRSVPWPKLNIVQVIKRYNGKRLSHIERRLAYGNWKTVHRLLVQTQTHVGRVNTAYIERFNATLRARLPSLVRRTRNVGPHGEALEMELFWSGVVYNFCTVHTTLSGTPAMAAGITMNLGPFGVYYS